jgi:hypothetical protein
MKNVVYDINMKTQNKCQTCHTTKDLRINSKRILKDGSFRCSYVCKGCNTKRLKKYRQTEKGRERQLQAIKNWEAKNPEKIRKIRNKLNTGYMKKSYSLKDPTIHNKYKARWNFLSRIKNGKIKRQPCVLCGSKNSQGHHPDYNQQLLICWLCPQCHHNVHYGVAKIDNSLYNDYHKTT